ncbi:galactose oxidase [Microthyrium microscopicum]|uniref:Galactose oxidase n=1 Tax=Microthyrium microscopicum TaxID=703497 RepID=A0A6A6U8Z2_9PEZI|nr:galactose oxidase [Microthyrium microscopicum]
MMASTTPVPSHSATSSPLGSLSSSNNTFTMPPSPSRLRKSSSAPYKPHIITTVGARPACLVNASVTYVGDDQIYAFGGFDQYTDEVYNHVLRLNLKTKQWNLVDNYGDIPGVRMGHTASLWEGHKLLVYGGENEHRAYLSDVIIFDLRSATWTQPEIGGVPPRGRARHSAVIHDEKLWISGGMTGHASDVLDDVCYLDLKTWTWSRIWKFVPRLDHTLWVWSGRIWAFGGMNEDMEHSSELWWIDFRGSPGFGQRSVDSRDRLTPSWKASGQSQSIQVYNPNAQSHTANSGSAQTMLSAAQVQNTRPSPGTVSMLKFVSTPHLTAQSVGHHFHVYSSGYLLDFATPASVLSTAETSLCALDLETLRWFRLADGKDLFNPTYRWHYCAMNEDGTQTWLLGCPPESAITRDNITEELLSDVLHIDLVKLGVIGNKLHSEVTRSSGQGPTSDTIPRSPLSAIGADLARMFDQPPETGSGTDFIVTGINDDEIIDHSMMDKQHHTTKSLHVHKLILQARWPHFARLYHSQMLEFHTKKLALPEPYSTVRAFLYYLYTDSIARVDAADNTKEDPSLGNVAGMLVMANMYDMPRLRGLCVDRLGKELDVEHAAAIWERASTAGEDWLRRRAARYCMTHWGRVVRTEAFRSLPQPSIVELCEEIDEEGRVLGGAELEVVGGLSGSRLGGGSAGPVSLGASRRRGTGSVMVAGTDSDEIDEDVEVEMDVS